MADEAFSSAANPGDLTDKEVEIAQWRVDVTDSGRWKIDEIYAEYWKDQENKKIFGKKFKAAVEGGRLKRIKALKHADGADLLSSDRQQLYDTMKLPE